MGLNISKIAQLFQDKNFIGGLTQLEQDVGEYFKQMVLGSVPPVAQPAVATVAGAVEQAAETATSDGLTGQSSAVLADLEAIGEKALREIELEVGGIISTMFPGIMGKVALELVQPIMGVLISKLTAATAPALSVAAGARVAKSSSSSPQAAATALMG